MTVFLIWPQISSFPWTQVTREKKLLYSTLSLTCQCQWAGKVKGKRSWKPETTKFEFWFWSCHFKDGFVSFSKMSILMTPTQLDGEQKVRQSTESTWYMVGVAHTDITPLLPSPSLFLVWVPFQIQLASLGVNMASLKPSAGRFWWIKVETKPSDFTLIYACWRHHASMPLGRHLLFIQGGRKVEWCDVMVKNHKTRSSHTHMNQIW